MAGVALERKGKSFAARQRVQSTATMPDGTGESGERRMNDTQRQNYRGNEAVFAWHDEARPRKLEKERPVLKRRSRRSPHGSVVKQQPCGRRAAHLSGSHLDTWDFRAPSLRHLRKTWRILQS